MLSMSALEDIKWWSTHLDQTIFFLRMFVEYFHADLPTNIAIIRFQKRKYYGESKLFAKPDLSEIISDFSE